MTSAPVDYGSPRTESSLICERKSSINRSRPRPPSPHILFRFEVEQQPNNRQSLGLTPKQCDRCRRHLHDEQLAKRHNLRLSNRKFKQFTSKYKSRVIICSHRRFIRLETNALKRLNKRSEGS